ncbi:VWA domain-containing protein [Dactylosporangium sp. CS-047395]|uniref:VWA domain-containing protein n=1 Tax=Dactylosporangium sp. CS-047395 TaxID=3239936 RepID=UPI003D91232F
MTAPARLPDFLLEVVAQLRHHQVLVGVDDLRELRACLRGGYGLGSYEDLRDVCVTLWAKSEAEAAVVRAVFARIEGLPRWTLPPAPPPSPRPPSPHPPADTDTDARAEAEARAETEDRAPEEPATRVPAQVHRVAGLPLPPRPAEDESLLLVPEYPTTQRQVAQAWRRLARRQREGPPVELDIRATAARYLLYGWEVQPALMPARRNTAALMVLVDRNGSMVPYHDYVDHVVASIELAGGLARMTTAYFHDLPAGRVDRGALATLGPEFRPDLDRVVEEIPPLADGRVYAEPQLIRPLSLRTVLQREAPGTGVVVISDAGAARGGFDVVRQHDTIALAKLLAVLARPLVWLNPAAERRWEASDAGRISRYVPMFPMTLEGMNAAVEVLRGHPPAVAYPL